MIHPLMVMASCGDYLQVVEEEGLITAATRRASERIATWPILTFDIIVLIAAVCTFLILNLFIRRLWLKAIVMMTGVFLFELFTSPMWHNEHLGRFAYVYCDVSWILTVGWTTLILGVVVSVDRWFPNDREPKRFAITIGILLALIVVAEIVVVALGIRKYSPEVLQAVSGISMMGVPIEILYYAPVFTTLVITFYKYWNFVIDQATLVPLIKRKWLRAILLAFIGVFMFELLVEPVVQNDNFPSWSYVYRDISFLHTGARVLLIAIGASVIGKYTISMPMTLRFFVGVLLISALYLPYEAWLVANGYRVYGETAVMNQIGFKSPITGLPIEIVFATPCYLSLIVCFIRYWEIVFDNRL